MQSKWAGAVHTGRERRISFSSTNASGAKFKFSSTNTLGAKFKFSSTNALGTKFEFSSTNTLGAKLKFSSTNALGAKFNFSSTMQGAHEAAVGQCNGAGGTESTRASSAERAGRLQAQ